MRILGILAATAGLVLALLAGTARAGEETVIEHYTTETMQMKIETVPARPTPSPIVEERTRILVPPVIEKRTTTETIETDD
jgi:hypothetical protein